MALISRTLSFVLILLLAAACRTSQVAELKTKPQDFPLSADKFERYVSKTVTTQYLVFVPKDYDKKKEWPLILFLHGAGERGTDVWRVNIHGPAKYIMENPDFPFIFVSPQCPPDEIWSNDQLIALLDEVEQKYKMDRSRVYLTGLSMGGYGTWELGTAHPERFAAMAPVCGGGRAILPVLAARGYAPKKLSALQTLGVWVFHGGKDTVVPPSESEHMIEALQVAKVKEIKYTLYPEKTHDSWTETYNNPELYEWFLAHRRLPSTGSRQ